MSTVTPSPLPSPGLPHFFTPKDEAQTTYASHIKTKTQAKTDLTLVTNEGDTVTLSAKSTLKTSYTSYNAQGRVQGPQDVAAKLLKLSAKNKVSVAVDGHLNAEEMADIEHLLGQIADIAIDFFTGDGDKTLSQALNIDDLDTIANFHATVRLKQRVSTTQLVAIEELPKMKLGVEMPDTQSLLPTTDLDATVDDMVKAARASNLAAKTLTNDLPGFVTSLFEQLADALAFDTSKRQLAATISTKFSQRLAMTENLSVADSNSTEPAVAVALRTKTSQRLKVTGINHPKGAETEVPPADFKVEVKTKSTQHLRLLTMPEQYEAKTAQQQLNALLTTRLVQQLKIA